MSQADRQDELHAPLERLKRDAIATTFADLALKAAKEGLSHEAYFFELAKQEEEQRM